MGEGFETSLIRVPIIFDGIIFEEVGIYDLVIKATSMNKNGWIVDNREMPIIVTVTDNGKGQLEAIIEYPDGDIEFEHTYQPKPVSVRIEASQSAVGAPLAGKNFKFGLFNESGELIARM